MGANVLLGTTVLTRKSSVKVTFSFALGVLIDFTMPFLGFGNRAYTLLLFLQYFKAVSGNLEKETKSAQSAYEMGGERPELQHLPLALAPFYLVIVRFQSMVGPGGCPNH